MSESPDAGLQATLARHLARIAPDDGAAGPTLLQIGRDRTPLAWGRPAASRGGLAHTGPAATLLILREFMHHLGYEAITIA